MALINKLENIAAAIREKTGKTDLLTLEQMPVEIAAIETGGGGGEELPEEAFDFSGTFDYVFQNGHWDWFINAYGDKITTNNLTNAKNAFYYCKAEEIPFELNFNNNQYRDVGSIFQLSEVKKIGKINNLYPSNMSYMFYSAKYLRELPEFVNLKMDRIYTYSYGSLRSMFESCYSLRKIPEELLKQLYTPIATSYTYTIFYYLTGLYTLDEIKGLNPQTGTMTGNMFVYSFTDCQRLKELIFATQEDGTPYKVNWKNQTIYLTRKVGYTTVSSSDGILSCSYMTDYNSGITMDKRVYDAESYAALKDDPDWFSGSSAYSRYNHDSAVNTINSLPDTSEYLAANGGTNTIYFTGIAGLYTDGGAINTLTEEEIAVATAKGWTVSIS